MVQTRQRRNQLQRDCDRAQLVASYGNGETLKQIADRLNISVLKRRYYRYLGVQQSGNDSTVGVPITGTQPIQFQCIEEGGTSKKLQWGTKFCD